MATVTSTLGKVALHLPSLDGLFIYRLHGKCPFPALWWNPPHNTVTSFTAPRLLGRVPPLLPSPNSLFSYSSVRDCPSPLLQHSGCPTLFGTCLFAVVVYYSVFFLLFLGWGSVCPGGYADLAQGCLWEYCMTLSSPGGLLLSSW
jgi:hypothetical protein